MLIAESTAKYAGGRYPQKRYLDLIDFKPPDNRSCEEITADIVQRCGLEVK